MTHFRQGSFYYRRKDNGRFLQVMYSADTRLASINEVSENVALFTFMNETNIEIDAVEFAMALTNALTLLCENTKPTTI